MTDYIDLEFVLEIHADQIQRFGGTSGVRDMGLLEAALARPQSGYYSDVIAEAAALWESLAQNHPFIDGNKRTAFASVYVFLRMNQSMIQVDPREAYSFVIGLYETNRFSCAQLEAWLRRNVT